MKAFAIAVLFLIAVFLTPSCGGGGKGLVNPGGTPDTLKPPNIVTASDGLLTDRVRITWAHAANSIKPDGYKIYRVDPNDKPDWVLIGTVLYVTVFDDVYVVPERTYRYAVVSYRQGYADSVFSNENTGWRP